MRDNWTVKRLGDICDSYSGGTPNRGNSSYYGGNIPWISSGEVNQASITETNEYITDKGLQFSSAKWIPKEAILVAMYGATAGQVSKLKIKATSNQAVLAVLPKDDDDYFLYYQLKGLKEKILFLAQGSGQPNLSKALIDETLINLPPLSQQRKIAKILSTCDRVIAKTEEAIAKYQAIKQGMMHDLFTRGIDLSTGKLRPKFQDAPELYKPSELGMIPKDWEVKRLEEFGSFKKGSNIPKYLLTPNGVGCILYGQLYTTFHDVIKQSYTKIPENHVKGMSPLNQGDILFAGSGETHEEIGKCAVLLSEEEIYAGGDIVILSLSENYCKPYFGYLLNFEPIQKQKAKLGQGSSVIHIYSNHLGSLKLSLPNKMEQEAIYQKIQSISEKISFEESTLSKYYQIKSGLMQDLLSGKVEVSVSKEEEIINA